MTLPSFKPITLGQVCVEFGAPGTTNLGAFVRGGAWVPDTSANSGVPTSKPITLGDLLGAEAYTYTAMTGSVSAVNGSYIASSGSHNIGTSYLTVSDGDPPYSKSWRASGSGFSASGSGTSASVYCSQNTAGTFYGTVYCDVTDATSNVQTFSNNVSATVNASYVDMTGSMADVDGYTQWPDAFSETANANISYGNASKTYNWSKISGQTSYFTLSPSGSSCGISANRAKYDTSNISMVLQCVVTDGTGSVTVTCTVTDNYL